MSAVQPKACLDEALRQAAVLAALRTPLPASSAMPGGNSKDPARALAGRSLQAARIRTDAAGLLAYQVNTQATAQRVLASSFPTLAAMLGADTLAALALILWQTQPPERGDLGEWGAALPDLLARHPDLRAWPWLADCARLDWARHQCERTADTNFDADSLLLLGSADPACLRMILHPHVHVLCSPWPVLALWTAHQLPPDQQARACAEALAAYRPPARDDADKLGDAKPKLGQDLAAGEAGELGVVVWRQGWQVQMAALPAAQTDWMRAVASNKTEGTRPGLSPATAASAEPADSAPDHMASPAAQHAAPPSLAGLLSQAPPAFDFTDWLKQALQAGWIWRLEMTDAP